MSGWRRVLFGAAGRGSRRWVLMGWLIGGLPGEGGMMAAAVSEPMRLVVRRQAQHGAESYALLGGGDDRLSKEAVGFYVVSARQWPAGLVPVFFHRRRGEQRLERFPLTGREAISEPLFFAALPEREGTDRRLPGRWVCRAWHEDGVGEFFSWDLTAREDRVGGRFDVDTDFRFASIWKGKYVNGRLMLEIRYIEAQYQLVGQWIDGRLAGEWTRVNEEGRGTWEATRGKGVAIPASFKTVRLWSYQTEDGSIRYRVEGEPVAKTWIRNSKPLCLVWRKSNQEPD